MKLLNFIGFNAALLLISFNGIAMGSGGKNLPLTAFDEIAKNSINYNAKTEAQIFALADKLEKAGGDSWRAMYSFIRSSGRKRGLTGQALENYNYGQFKADIMSDILKKRAPGAKDFGPEIIDQAIDAEAYKFAKYYSKELQKGLDEKLYDMLAFYRLGSDSEITKKIEQKGGALSYVETLLKFGADPNHLTKWDERNQNSTIFYYFLFFGLQTFNVLGETKSKEIQAKLKTFANEFPDVLKLLLKYGANPDVQDPLLKGKTLMNYLNDKLKEHQGAIKFYTGIGNDDMHTKFIKALIKIVPEERAKYLAAQKSKK